jgi:excisionase family DNA binding protein
MLGVSHPTIYTLINTGRLHSVRVGARRLISVSDLRRLVDEQ